MRNATRTAARSDPLFPSYVALANGLVGDLGGICLLNGALKSRGQHGDLTGEAIVRWIRSLGWTELEEAPPTACARGSTVWWTAIPLLQSEGSFLGVFCVSQEVSKPPTQPSRYAANLAVRLKPLRDCIHRDLAAAIPARARAQTLTERSAELEWLFKVTSNLKGAVDDRRVLEELLREATSRLDSGLGVLHVPDKRLSASVPLREAWSQTREHLMT